MIIGKKCVNDSSPVCIIAEIGVNHNGQLQLAKQLVKESANSGADAVKFQAFVPKEISSLRYRKEEIEMLEKYTLSESDFLELKEETSKYNLEFIITPFDIESLEMISRIGVSAIKIGSGELTHTPFLQKVAEQNIPVILSTGAGTIEDVERAVNVLQSFRNDQIAILHCLSAYPAPPNELNLNVIKNLKKHFKNKIIGYSDHSLGITASIGAVALGAQIIEKHITLDCKMEGPDHHASANVEEFFKMSKEIRSMETMLGSGIKKPMHSEGTIGRSIVAAFPLQEGRVLSEKDLAFKRPGDGLRPYRVDDLIGKVLIRNIDQNEKIKLDDVR